MSTQTVTQNTSGTPSQQNADDNPAMPTAKFGTRKFFRWFTDTESLNEFAGPNRVEAKRSKYTIHLIVKLRKVTTISLSGWPGICGTTPGSILGYFRIC